MGRQAFSDLSLKPQCESVRLEDGRTLHVTHMPMLSMLTLTNAYRETGRTDFPFKDQDAVVLVAGIKSDLTVDYRSVWTYDLRKICGEDFFRKKAIFAVFDESLFTKAQTEGKVKGTLLSWFRQQEDTHFQAVFQEVQERCILIDQKGTDESLMCNRRQLAHIVDYHILGKYDYTNLRLTDAQQRSQELEKQVQDVGNQVRGLKKDLQEKTSQFNKVGNQVTELKKDLQEKTSQFNKVGNQVTELKKDFQEQTSQFNKVGNQVTELNKDLQEKTSQFNKVGNHVTDLTKDLQEKTSQFNKLGNQVIDLKKEFQEQTSQVNEVGNQVTELKKDFQEQTSQVNEVGNQVTELKKDFQEQTSQVNEVGNQVTDLKKDFQQEMSDMNELVQTLRDENRSMRERSLWAIMKLLVPSLPVQTSPRLRLFLLALLVSMPLLLPLIWGGATNKRRQISMLDEGPDHRRYMNNKLQEIAKRFKAMEEDLADLKMSSPGKSGKMEGDLETKPTGTDSDDAAERKEQMQEQLAELKGQVEDLKQVIGENSQAKGIILLDMLRSLPLSLPLIISLTTVLLALVPVRLPVPVPFSALLLALLGSLLIIQLLLLFIFLSK